MEALWQCLNLFVEMLNQPRKLVKPKLVANSRSMGKREMQELERNLMALEKELMNCREDLRRSMDGSDTEMLFLERIQILEDLRFQILSQINGNRVERYNSMPA